MSALADMQEGSFRGVTFLTSGMSTRGGRKNIVYEFPNSDRRFVEDMGLFRKEFTLDVHIQGPNYINRRDQFILALERPGTGLLIHPLFGSQEVFSKNYYLNEDISHLDCANFSIDFVVAESNIFPQDSEFNFNQVFNTSDSLFGSMVNDITNTFSNSNATNFGSSQNVVGQMLGQFDNSTRFLISANDSNNDFVSQLISYRDQLSGIISRPSDFATRTRDLFDSVNLLGSTSRERFGMNRSFFGFNRNFIKTPPKTTSQRERLINTNLVNNSVNLFSLVNAYRTIIDIDFISIQELIEFSNIVEDQYQDVIDANYEDAKIDQNEGDFSEETIEELTTIRTQVNGALRDLREDLVNVIEITTPKKALLTFVFERYGNLDRLQDIISLNNFPNTQFVEGEVLIFENSTEQSI